MSAGLLASFPLRGARCVHLIGGGGKTTLMFALANAHAAAGRRAITTTTTKIGPPRPGETPRVLLAAGARDLVADVRAALAEKQHVTVIARTEGEKRMGLSPADVDALVDAGLADLVLVEADGARRLPFKAHRDGEPVFADRCDHAIAVVGMRALGTPVDEAHVHRAEILRARLALPEGARVTPDVIASTLCGPSGWLARVPAGVPVTVFASQAGGDTGMAGARAVAAALRAADAAGRIGAIVAGDVLADRFETLAGPGAA